jgi:hypothetical protein
MVPSSRSKPFIVALTARSATFDKIEALPDPEFNIAPITPIVLDKDLILANRNTWFFLDWQNAVDSDGKPLESGGWYWVNREMGTLEKISDKKVKGLEWHERLHIFGTVEKAIKEHRPLALVVYDASRLLLIGLYDNENAMRVAQVKEETRVHKS